MKQKVTLRVALVKQGLEFLGFSRKSDGRISRSVPNPTREMESR
jgi:hypothetical protein